MHLGALECEHFRNLEPLRLEPHPRFNVLEGGNGEGKTSLLEAVYVLATLRSFREARSRTMVAWDAREAVVRGDVTRRGVSRRLGVEIGPRGKRAATDGRQVTRLADYLGQLHVVVFGPEDLALSKGGPALRRRFLDRAIFNVQPGYLEEARAYQAALRHRNEVLREAAERGWDAHVTASFDEELVRRGARVLWRRLDYLARFRPLFGEIFEAVHGGRHEATLRYRGSVVDEATSRGAEAAPGADGQPRPGGEEPPDEATLAERLRARLEADRSRDVGRGRTHAGPHVDDLELGLDGRSARRFASQGQHRTLALALKIAELQRAAEELDAPPLLLLDDVSSELDRERNGELMRYLDRAGGQVLVTTTDRSWIRLQGAGRVYRIEAGRVTPVAG